jgi:hypothetical protein
MAFPSGTAYHADSDADDEYERSVVASPTALQTDSETSSEPPSNEHTPTTFDVPGEDGILPRTVITEWTPEECAQFVASLSLRQYCDAFIGKLLICERGRRCITADPRRTWHCWRCPDRSEARRAERDGHRQRWSQVDHTQKRIRHEGQTGHPDRA